MIRALLLSLLLIVSCKPELFEKPILPIDQKVMPQEVLVKFKPGTSDKKRRSSIKKCNGKVVTHLEGINVYHLRVSSSIGEAISCLNKSKVVEYVEPNQIVHTY